MKILVLGSVNQDLVIRMERIPKPGETLFGQTLQYFPGGKGANQAVAAARLGAHVYLVANVGDDAFGENMKIYLASQGLETGIVSLADTPTGTAIITVDGAGENAITVVSGANSSFTLADLEVLNRFGQNDWLLVQNEITISVVFEAIRLAKKLGMKVMYNPAPALLLPADIISACDFIVVNEHELGVCFGQSQISNLSATDTDQLISLLAAQFQTTIVLTLGSSGCISASPGELTRVAGHTVQVADTTGAGDCFCGALLAALTTGFGQPQALRFANQAAALSVEKSGASISFPTREEVDQRFSTFFG